MVQHDQINVDAGAEELIHELTVDGICYLPEVCCFDPNRHIVVAACSHILWLESRKLQQTSTATLGKPQRLSQEIP